MGLDDMRTSWNRVPAQGSLFEKVRQPAQTAKGNTHYIYTGDKEASISFGFDALPEYGPVTYGKLVVHVSAKNVAEPAVLALTLKVGDEEKSFSTPISKKYEVHEFVWDGRDFSKEEISTAVVTFPPSETVNYINAVQLIVDEPK
jgi:hypothetical protein